MRLLLLLLDNLIMHVLFKTLQYNLLYICDLRNMHENARFE